LSLARLSGRRLCLPRHLGAFLPPKALDTLCGAFSAVGTLVLDARRARRALARNPGRVEVPFADRGGWFAEWALIAAAGAL
jgi:hypothetical protein